jgi:hypothetical protein
MRSFAFLLLLWVVPGISRAADQESVEMDVPAAGDAAAAPAACADEACVLHEARALLDGDRPEQAARWLDEQLERFPDSGPIQILLGVAQLRSAQPLWAVDTFSRRLEQAPDDCEARTWLAWAWLGFAAVDEALAVVQEGDCATRDPWAARVSLLRAFAAQSAGDDETARRELEAARRTDSAFAADIEALAGFRRQTIPDRLDELAWRIDFGAGYTSNALLGSPTDPSRTAANTASPVVLTDIWLRLAPDFGFWLKPVVELTPKVLFFPFESVREQSYLDLSGRIGAYLDWDIPRILLAYKPSYLLLFDDPDGPLWYYSAHRFEVEAEIFPYLMAFAGAGQRTFDEMGRNRVELDGGFGGNLPFVGRLGILWTLSGRGSWAQDPAYTQGGITGSFNLQYRWVEGLSSRIGITLAGDWYPDSAGAEAFGSPTAARTDFFLRAGYSLWSPALWGFRLGLSYDYSRRDSTVNTFSFEDHRVLFKITWAGAADLIAPSASDDTPVADFDWGMGQGESALVERVQDLLRQEEQVYRSCGCAE